VSYLILKKSEKVINLLILSLDHVSIQYKDIIILERERGSNKMNMACKMINFVSWSQLSIG